MVKEMITYGNFQIIKISIPLVLGMMIQVMVGLTDTAFLGRVGEVELGASAIGGIFYIMVYMVLQSLGVGAQIIMARRNGEKKLNKIAAVFYQTIKMNILFSLFCIVIIYEFAKYFLEFAVNDYQVSKAVSVYLLPRCWGLIFAGSIAVLRSYFLATTHTKPIFLSSVVLLISNFIFDYVLIFGKLGFPAMGLAGAALASVLAELITMFYFAGYLIFNVKLTKYGFEKFVWWNKKLCYKIIRLSVWIVVQNLLNWGAWFYFFIEIEKLGAKELAVSNILRSLSSLPYVVANAFAIAVSSIVSNLIGAGKEKEVIPTIFRVVKIASLPFYLFLGIMVAFPIYFLKIYTNDISLIQSAIYPLFAVAFTYTTALPGLVYFYAVYGTGKTNMALVIEIICTIAYIITIKINIDYLQASLTQCWFSELPYHLILWMASYWYIKRKKWCCEII